MEFPSFSQAANIPAGWTPPDKNNEITLQIGAAETETLDVARFYIGSKELLLDKTDFTSVEKANASMGYLDAAVEASYILKIYFFYDEQRQKPSRMKSGILSIA